MDTKSLPNPGTPNPETVTPSPTPSAPSARSGRQTGRAKKAASTDEPVSVTFSFDSEFARQLKMVTAATGEASSALVQRLIWPVLRKEAQRLLKEMSGLA